MSAGVSAEMRARLLVNREGRLHRRQMLDLVSQPLVVALLLAVPVVYVIGARATLLVVSPIWRLFLIATAIYLLLRMALRGWRYARMPVRFGVMRGTGYLPARFWQTPPLETEDGARIRFRERLAPPLRPRAGERYLVYYLQDGGDYILLSLAPADHPHAAAWYPAQP